MFILEEIQIKSVQLQCQYIQCRVVNNRPGIRKIFNIIFGKIAIAETQIVRTEEVRNKIPAKKRRLKMVNAPLVPSS